MRLTRRDWLFIAVIGVVLATLLANGLREKPKKMPRDAAHGLFLKALSGGEKRAEVERKCPACHNSRLMPMPRRHPPKEQCLICHKW